MGYSHQWSLTKPIAAKTWRAIMDDANRLTAFFVAGQPASGSLCESRSHPERGPLIDHQVIQFNGTPSGCEDFCLRKTVHKAFCKTEYCPYDRIVCAVLAAAAARVRDIVVMSDGNRDDWAPHIAWCEQVLGRTIPNPVGATRPL